MRDWTTYSIWFEFDLAWVVSYLMIDCYHTYCFHNSQLDVGDDKLSFTDEEPMMINTRHVH